MRGRDEEVTEDLGWKKKIKIANKTSRRCRGFICCGIMYLFFLHSVVAKFLK